MASIDWSVLGLGALVGIGCRKELRAAGRVAASTAASLAATAAQACQQVAAETQKASQPSEEEAAKAWLEHIDQLINQRVAGGQSGQSTQAGQNPNPNGN